MQKIVIFLLLLLFLKTSTAQTLVSESSGFFITVINDHQQFVQGITIELFNAAKKKLVKSAVSNSKGQAIFYNIEAGEHYFIMSGVGYLIQTSPVYTFPFAAGLSQNQTIQLTQDISSIQDVTIVGTRPFVQQIHGKVLINVDAAVTNVGTSVLEVLEKSPGVMIDRNGIISLQAKTGVLVLIDDKPTYLSGADLTNLLSSMSSSQVDVIELLANPPAKYDAAGNAGVINIKTKKNKQKGFNGTLTVAPGQGRYTKSNNSLILNYRKGKFNTFLSYSVNWNRSFIDLFAIRKYYNPLGDLLASLVQPTIFKGTSLNNTLKTGLDFYPSDKTTIGISFSGIAFSRESNSNATATWKNSAGLVDSTIGTYGTSSNRFKNGGINLSLKKVVNSSQDYSIDVDWIDYAIRSEQFFNNKLLSNTGYTESTRGNIPSSIQIFSAKADHTFRLAKGGKIESGWKFSNINTDNLANYQLSNNGQWVADLGKSNNFLYKERIHAFYSNFATKKDRFTIQAGIRYEYTGYRANQLGNSIQKDSAFSRNYQGLFPSGFVSYQADSSNAFTFTTGRRIDRPAFQKLNPFVFIINKYTYQKGNPFYLPQFSWNLELSHQYKSIITTAISYSKIENYFSQLFLTDSSGILIYTEGNVGYAKNIGASITVQVSPFKWWSLTSQTIFNNKELKGFADKYYTASINQINLNINNQFRINQIYTAELSGIYTTRALNDLQEILSPTGQIAVGFARPVLKNKGTLKVSIRDLFYTQINEGITQFKSAEEYFVIWRDTRVANIAFTWRFGKQLKTIKRSTGGAGAEMQRVGTGN